MKAHKNTLWILLGGIIAVSTASIFIRLAQESLPSNLIAAGRLFLSILILAPFTLRRAKEEFLKLEKRSITLVAIAGIFLGVHFLTWIKSLEITTVSSSVFLVTTTPIWVAIFSPLLLKEKISKQVVIGLAIAMVGIIVMVINPSHAGNSFFQFDARTLLGNFLALCGAWMATGYTIAGRKVREQLSLQSYVFIMYSIAAFVAVVFSIPTILETPSFEPQAILWVFLLALIPQVIGHTLFNAAIRQIPAVYASIALLGEPIGTIILTWIFLNETPSRYNLLGGLFIILGILVAFFNRNVNRSSSV